MNTFIFQSLPENNDLRDKLIPGLTETWLASRYRNEMKVGDLVYFWMGGDDRFRGIYGFGKIVTEPYKNSEIDSYGVDVKYLAKFTKVITSSYLKTDSELRNLLIIRAPQATNFLVDESQGKKLLKLIRTLGEKEPKII